MSSFTRINAEQAKALLDQGNANIADIRDNISFAAGHMQGAQHVDNSNLKAFMASAATDAPLIVCCYHGNSSQGAAQFFAEQGYEQAYSLDGGYELWKVTQPDLCETN